MLRVNAINRQGLLKCLTFNPKSLVFKTVSVPVTDIQLLQKTQRLPEQVPVPSVFYDFYSL